MEKIMIAMSGGVDSSVAAVLLQSEGHDCAGVHLKLFVGEETEPRERSCCSLQDAEDARAAARRLKIPFYVFSFAEIFHKKVISRFVESYLRGETPNPCIDCNRVLKFGALLERAQTLEYSGISTGHYVRREFDGRWQLRRGLDVKKDQSYVLYGMTQEQLAHTLFPLGNYHKAEVRKIAEEAQLLNFQKKDSQDICFVPDGNYPSFLEKFTGTPCVPGNFIDATGKILGQHRGTPCYTIGQRKGLGLALSEPGYVTAIDPRNNRITVGRESELYSREAWAQDLNFISVSEINQPLRCKARVRYHQEEQPAIVEQTARDEIHIQFDQPQRAITPGQALVLYAGDYVIGGGRLKQKPSSTAPPL